MILLALLLQLSDSLTPKPAPPRYGLRVRGRGRIVRARGLGESAADGRGGLGVRAVDTSPTRPRRWRPVAAPARPTRRRVTARRSRADASGREWRVRRARSGGTGSARSDDPARHSIRDDKQLSR